MSGEAHPWDENESGLWCIACGNHIAAPHNLADEDFSIPTSCRQCGFPDFEDGTGYFTDDDEPEDEIDDD